MIRAAKYAGRCQLCKQPFAEGAKIDDARLYGFERGYLTAYCAKQLHGQRLQGRRIDARIA